MGQFALGIRSLVVKATLFVIMAALLAWALGGTLFPKPEVADFRQHAVQFDGHTWHWRVMVGGKNDGEVRWNLMRRNSDGKDEAFLETAYVEVAGPIATGKLFCYAGRESGTTTAWRMTCVDSANRTTTITLPDRLAVEQQLSRMAAGLPMQDAQTIAQQRARVLDPLAESADK